MSGTRNITSAAEQVRTLTNLTSHRIWTTVPKRRSRGKPLLSFSPGFDDSGEGGLHVKKGDSSILARAHACRGMRP
jgi:hypothetical protein